MEKMVDKGLTRSIGVCNCGIPQMMDILTYAKIKPAVNQIELHPYLPQHALTKFLMRFGIHSVAYAPLGATNWVFKDPEYHDVSLIEDPFILQL